MLKTLLAVLLLSLPRIACAQAEPQATLTLPGVGGNLDLAGLVKSLHPVYVYDQHGDSLAGADIHALTLSSAGGVEWLHVCPGVVWRTSDGLGGPMASIRVRWDNLLGNALGTSWAQKHVKAVKLPQVEMGPFGGYIARLGWLYGVTAALAF